jgi:hypothetical protein
VRTHGTVRRATSIFFFHVLSKIADLISGCIL